MINKKTYLVSFLITQKGDYTDWIENVILSGLNEEESLDTLCITELEGENNELG